MNNEYLINEYNKLFVFNMELLKKSVNQKNDYINASDILKELSLISPKINKKFNHMEGWNWKTDFQFEDVYQSGKVLNSPIKNNPIDYDKGISQIYIQNLKNIMEKLNTPEQKKQKSQERKISKEKEVSVCAKSDNSQNHLNTNTIVPKIFIPEIKKNPLMEKVINKILSISKNLKERECCWRDNRKEKHRIKKFKCKIDSFLALYNFILCRELLFVLKIRN